jgi:hypothetical protein
MKFRISTSLMKKSRATSNCARRLVHRDGRAVLVQDADRFAIRQFDGIGLCHPPTLAKSEFIGKTSCEIQKHLPLARR